VNRVGSSSFDQTTDRFDPLARVILDIRHRRRSRACGMLLAERAQGHLDCFVHQIFHCIIMIRLISIDDTACGDLTLKGSSGPHSTRGPGCQHTCDGVPLGRHEKMDLESIKVPLLAGDIAPISRLVLDGCMRNTVIITHRYRNAINDVA
jgi:hypothetical protein